MDTAYLWNSRKQDDWNLALELYDEVLKEEEKKYDRDMDMISANPDIVRYMTGEEFYYFLYNRYFAWKYTQHNIRTFLRKRFEGYYESDEGKMFLGIIKNSIFNTHDSMPQNTETLLNLAISISCIGVAAASGLLAVLFPQDFGTVDQFIVYEMGSVEEVSSQKDYKQIKPKALKVKDGVFLENVLRDKAKQLNSWFETGDWTPKKVDMILWAIHRHLKQSSNQVKKKK